MIWPYKQKKIIYWKKNAGNKIEHVADREKHIIRLANQARLKSFQVAVKYKYGFKVPKDYKRGMEMDKIAGNNKWRNTNILEYK